jgi:hypothetical protein
VDTDSTPQPALTVPAHWALVSKRLDPSGAYAIEGYEVVGTSGSPALAQSLQESCLTGTPSSTAVGTADAIPWVVVTGGGVQGAVMAMSVVTSSTLRTEAGRAVTPTRIIWTPWPDAERCRLSWAAMAAAHQSMRWSETVAPAQAKGDAVTLPVAGFDAPTVADDIDRFGFDWVAGLAGLILEGRRIAIVAEAAPLPDVEERLKLFDAVCALLPYGYRARFSAATWAKANVEHGVLLVFADAVAKDQQRVGWQAPLPRPHHTDALDYVDALRRLRNGDANFRTVEIVEHLLKEADPQRCRDAEAVRGYLMRMDLPREVVRLINAKRGRLADVRRVLAEHPLDTLPSSIAQTLVQFLADGVPQSQAARDLVVQIWSGEVERRLGAYGRALLTTAGVPVLRHWFAVADRAGPESRRALLRELLRRTGPMPDLAPASADVAVQLLSEFKGAINDVVLQQVIAAQPNVCLALLCQILDRSIPIERAVTQIDRWLLDPSSGEHPWLAPFGFAIGRDEPTADQWHALRNVDDRVWRVLLHIAASRGLARRVFASMWPSLLDRAGRLTTSASDEAFNAELGALLPERYGLPVQDVTRIDMLHLARFGTMPYLAAEAVQIEPYAEAFQLTWCSPVLADRRDGWNQLLVRAVFPERGGAVQAAKLMAVARVDARLVEVAARAIAQEVDTRPGDFDATPFDGEWIGRIRRYSSRENFWVYQELRSLAQEDVGVHQIATGYERGRRIGLRFEDLDRILHRWICHHPPELIEQLLTELWWRGFGEDADKLRRRIASGEHGGRRVAEDWQQFIRDQLILTQWLAGKGKLPRQARRQAPPPKQDRAAHGQANSPPSDDAGGGSKLSAAARKIAGTIRPGRKHNDGDEQPATSNG